MRYARATDDFYVPEAEDVRTQVGKPGAYSFEPVSPELAEQTREELQAVYEQAFATYERLVEAGVARELARAVMPVGAYTEFYWTVNARALMNFVAPSRARERAARDPPLRRGGRDVLRREDAGHARGLRGQRPHRAVAATQSSSRSARPSASARA